MIIFAVCSEDEVKGIELTDKSELDLDALFK